MRRRPPRQGDHAWYHDVIPIVLAFVALGIAIWILFNFMYRTDW
jgi:hypothetical protein